MEFIWPQELLATPGMVSVSVIILCIQLASLAFFALCSYEFKQLLHRHARLFRGIGGSPEHERLETTSRALFIVYIVMTVLTTLVTGLLFIFQPHLL